MRGREGAGDTSRPWSENKQDSVSVRRRFRSQRLPHLSRCLSLLQPSSFPPQLDRNTRSAAGAEERICWVTDHVEQAGASTTSAEVVFFPFFFFLKKH